MSEQGGATATMTVTASGSVTGGTGATVTETVPEIITDNGHPHSPLAIAAEAAGLSVLAAAAWPESAADAAAPALAGFVVSSFSPIAAEVARRCHSRRPAAETADDPAELPVTAVIVISELGDITSAEHVAETVDTDGRIGPLLFFQSVPNAVAGYIATKAGLTGPVVCVGGVSNGLDVAALLIEDGDADEALLVRIDLARAADLPDRAEAVLLAAGSPYSEGVEP